MKTGSSGNDKWNPLPLIIAALFLAIETGCSISGIEKTPSPTPTVPLSVHTGPAFPRLGMWWPDSWHQPLEQIARYDWVILGDYQEQFIDPIRAINPNIILLTDTDALELHYYPDDPASNQAILKVPYQWFLTQVGSTLREDIDLTQTTLPVNEVTVTSGPKRDEKTIDLFQAGDTALIENESVYIKSVDAANKTLTVERGYIRPASAHKSGTRIAAHVSTWPSTWMLNVSTLSPKGIADASVGPETWPEYNARVGAQLLADPRWSGILVDRTETGQARYIDGTSIRSIDPDQSNRLLSDYSEFDSTWSDGLSLYLKNLRQAIGPKRIIYLNWGIEDYGMVNGDNFEGFPDDGGGSGDNSWNSIVVGPYHRGSYFDWVAKALQPNLTMLETYEDNSVPSGDYDNPCDKADFTPNYRKMRFGLTTALLNDGYFSYEMNTVGHGSLCLMWFDEYDNAGAGKGYLGYPLGPAYKIKPERLSVGKSGLDVWERDYENGIVLVNATSDPLTIPLGGSFRKIKGSQDASVNDGSLVTQVTLPAVDGIILLKP